MGRLINITSVAGKDGNPNASAYSASKAAVIAVTKSLGKELTDISVRVNCVTPAAVRKPIFAQMTQAHIDYMLSKILPSAAASGLRTQKCEIKNKKPNASESHANARLASSNTASLSPK
jgi:NAD(P)-dependent dehydrogenase (short-subunit alcohol dehydrogenase family)